MKRIILFFFILTLAGYAQPSKTVTPTWVKSQITDSLNAIRTLIGTGGIVLPDSVFYESQFPDSFDTRFNSTSIGQIKEINDYEPVIADSSILLYSGGVWSIFDLSEALANISSQSSANWKTDNTTIEATIDSTLRIKTSYSDTVGNYRINLNTVNPQLSNLGTTAINANLIPSGYRTLGILSNNWLTLWTQELSYQVGDHSLSLVPSGSITSSHTYYLPDISGTIPVGTGTANQLSYWSGTNTLGSLNTATYPSLTELSYVKGLTSALQTQLNAKLGSADYSYLNGRIDLKANSTDPTFTDTIKIANLTSDIAIITPAGGIGGGIGIRTGETVQVEGDSPSFGFKIGANISDIVPPEPMTSNWDWALPNKSGTVALTSDISDSLNAGYQSAYTGEQIDSLLALVSTGSVDSNVVNDLIEIYLNDSSYASSYTGAQIDSLLALAGTALQVSGSTRTKSAFDIITPGIDDSLMVFWLDDGITIDSMKVETTDSIAIQVGYDKGTDYEGPPLYLFSEGTLITSSSTFTTADFSTYSLEVDDKAYLYFTFVSSATTRLKIKIYWRYL